MENEVIIRRKLGIIPKIFLFIILTVLLFYCYMRFLEPHLLVVQETSIVHPLIPDSFNGFKIVQFSDIHFGRTTSEREVKKVVSKINELKPDILIFSGDLFDQYTDNEKSITFLKEAMKSLDATLGKYAIMGDSDTISATSFNEIFLDAEFTILEGKNIPIYYKGNIPIYLNGVSSATNIDNEGVFLKDDPDAFQIFVTHEPILFDKVWNNAHLVFAGHSLGGLINIPFIGGIYRLPNTGNYLSGEYKRGNSTLYVSRGIGTQGISLRLLNMPSISLYRLYNYD